MSASVRPMVASLDPPASDCKTRYVAINVFPLASVSASDKYTIVVSKQTDLETLDVTEGEKELSAITAPSASPFLQTDGAMNLVAATTASLALIAATLY